jgi:hypothetical protein
MKISGPGSKLPPEGPGAADEAKRSPGSGFAEKVGQRPLNQIDPLDPAATARTAATHLVADISAELQAGRITPQIALDRVIDRVIDQQVGASAPAGVRERVGAALRQALEDDPLLAEKLRTLGG